MSSWCTLLTSIYFWLISVHFLFFLSHNSFFLFPTTLTNSLTYSDGELYGTLATYDVNSAFKNVVKVLGESPYFFSTYFWKDGQRNHEKKSPKINLIQIVVCINLIISLRNPQNTRLCTQNTCHTNTAVDVRSNLWSYTTLFVKKGLLLPNYLNPPYSQPVIWLALLRYTVHHHCIMLRISKTE